MISNSYQQFSFLAMVIQYRRFVILYVMPQIHCIASKHAMNFLSKLLFALAAHTPNENYQKNKITLKQIDDIDTQIYNETFVDIIPKIE